jgi:2-methylisocitrate lyase-like PEP mutase family enzyme
MSAWFADLHHAGTFVLVNVHDPGSAAVAQAVGAVALGTTGSGHAYSLARYVR